MLFSKKKIHIFISILFFCYAQFHRQRILQYLSKAHVQSTENRSKFDEDNHMAYLNDTKRNVVKCRDAQMAQYIAKYIQFLYYCLNTNQN